MFIWTHWGVYVVKQTYRGVMCCVVPEMGVVHVVCWTQWGGLIGPRLECSSESCHTRTRSPKSCSYVVLLSCESMLEVVVTSENVEISCKM